MSRIFVISVVLLTFTLSFFLGCSTKMSQQEMTFKNLVGTDQFEETQKAACAKVKTQIIKLKSKIQNLDKQVIAANLATDAKIREHTLSTHAEWDTYQKPEQQWELKSEFLRLGAKARRLVNERGKTLTALSRALYKRKKFCQ